MKFPGNILLALAAVLSSVGAQARYNGEDRGRPVMPIQVNAKWQQVC